MAGVSLIRHKGVEIVYADYTNCRTEKEMLEVLSQMATTVKKINGPYLQLANFTNSYLTKGYMAAVKELAKTLPQTATKRAIVGINNNSKKILLKIYNLLIKTDKIVAFDTLEQAKDWIVEK